MELHELNGQFYVKIFYKPNSSEMELSPLDIPECGASCPIEKFKELYDDIIPKQSPEIECSVKSKWLMVIKLWTVWTDFNV